MEAQVAYAELRVMDLPFTRDYSYDREIALKEEDGTNRLDEIIKKNARHDLQQFLGITFTNYVRCFDNPKEMCLVFEHD